MSEETSSTQPNPGSHFLAGLTAGVLLGVAGYYLFGTKQGQETREKISDEWERARELLGSTTTEQSPDTEKWQQFFSQIAQELGFQRQRQRSKPRATTKTSIFVKKAKQVKKSIAKFTGV
jgi:gas vesicle protein